MPTFLNNGSVGSKSKGLKKQGSNIFNKMTIFFLFFLPSIIIFNKEISNLKLTIKLFKKKSKSTLISSAKTYQQYFSSKLHQLPSFVSLEFGNNLKQRVRII
jgi:hypothetical protein